MIVDSFKTDRKEVKALPFDIVNHIREIYPQTWSLRDVIIWNKLKNLPWYGKGHFKNHFEYILFFSKGESIKFHIDEIREIVDLKKWWLTYPERYSPKGVSPSNVWEIPPQIKGWSDYNSHHMCPFPFRLVEKIITLSSDKGDLVLDPFAGSGSVIAMASIMGRDAIGIDINKKYKKEFKSVLQDAQKYWARRTAELDTLKRRLSDYRTINIRLRQLKLAAVYCGYLNDAYIDRKNLIGYICTRDSSKSRKIKLRVQVRRSLDRRIEETDVLRAFAKQTKIKYDLKIVASEKKCINLPRRTMFKYAIDRPYKALARIETKDLVTENEPWKYIYSDIGLNVARPDDIEKKDLEILLLS
jgi:hypothetical protein